MRIAYFDCFSGICGNMILGAMVDLGYPKEALLETINLLDLKGFSIKINQVIKKGIKATHLHVDIDYKNKKSRNYKDIRELIEKTNLNDRVKTISLEIFSLLAKAEATIHGVEIDDVHFHEVGATDSIIDIVGGAAALVGLNIDVVYSSVLPLGSGFVDCQHGKLPIPAPAVLEILKGVPIEGSFIKEELVTPTGAAFVKNLSKEFGEMPDMVIEKVGYGAGDKDIEEIPNLLRVILGESTKSYENEKIWVIETDIDDLNPQITGDLLELFLEKGALDVNLIPVYMKKNRPGITIKMLAREDKKKELIDLIFKETTTIGIRSYLVERFKLNREIKSINTPFGSLKVKISKDNKGNILNISPEFEDLKKLSVKHNLPLKELYQRINIELIKLKD